MKPRSLRFRGEVRGGKLFPASRQYFDEKIRNFSGNVVIIIEKIKPVRSLHQNAYYWGAVLPTIAEHTGHTPEELHEIYKRMFIRRQVVRYNNKEVVLPGSTTRLSKGEFIEYLMKIEAEAANMGIQIPTPDDYYSDMRKKSKEKVARLMANQVH